MLTHPAYSMEDPRFLAFGMNSQGQRLFPPFDQDTFLQHQLNARSPDDEVNMKRCAARGGRFRSTVLNPHNPREAGWSFLVAANDPDKDKYIQILRPLAEKRGMIDPEAPLEYTHDPENLWMDWFEEFTFEKSGEPPKPRFVMIVGSPQHIPFTFQFMLNSYAFVGRVAFDALGDLETFVTKLLRLEATPSTVTRDAVVFGTHEGNDDPTRWSHRYMVLPFAHYLEKNHQMQVDVISGTQATKGRLVDALKGTSPAMVYTASHGLGAFDLPMEKRLELNGAICCKRERGAPMSHLFSVNDVPGPDTPFLEGSVFFQFACFGMGTPAVSHFQHWFSEGLQGPLADYDFLAALPKKLLAHPRGPIAFVGHLDVAFADGFYDIYEERIRQAVHPRIHPFQEALDTILDSEPLGLVLEEFNRRYNISNTRLLNTFDRLERNNQPLTAIPNRQRFIDTWIMRSDARNYMLFGDPASASQLEIDQG